MSVATADLQVLAARMAKARNEGIQKAAHDVIQDAATKIQATAQSLAPVKTGALKESITIRYTGPTSAVIGPNVSYGIYQELGTGSKGEFPTGPYEIRPKNGKYLKFQVNGKWIYTKKVIHPGIKAQPYMRPAAKQVISEIAPDLAKSGALQIVGDNA